MIWNTYPLFKTFASTTTVTMTIADPAIPPVVSNAALGELSMKLAALSVVVVVDVDVVCKFLFLVNKPFQVCNLMDIEAQTNIYFLIFIHFKDC